MKGIVWTEEKERWVKDWGGRPPGMLTFAEVVRQLDGKVGRRRLRTWVSTGRLPRNEKGLIRMTDAAALAVLHLATKGPSRAANS